MFSLLGIFALFVIYAVRFVVIWVEGCDYAPKKYKINIYQMNSISYGNNFKNAVMSLLIALVTLLLGALAGAVASAIYSAPSDNELSNFSSTWDWFIDSTIRGNGALTLLLLIVLVLEIVIIFIYFRHFNSKSNPFYLDEVYGSFQIGELSKDNLGEKFKKELSKALPEIFKNHPIVKMYTNLNRVNIWGFRKLFRKKLVSRVSVWSFCIRLPFLLFLFCDVFLVACHLLSVNRDNFESFLLFLCVNVFIFVFVYLILFTRMIISFELGILGWRIDNLRKSYLIIKGKRDYIEKLLKG